MLDCSSRWVPTLRTISALSTETYGEVYVRLTSTSYSPRRTVPLETDKSDFLGIVMISFKYRPMCKAVNNSLIELWKPGVIQLYLKTLRVWYIFFFNFALRRNILDILIICLSTSYTLFLNKQLSWLHAFEIVWGLQISELKFFQIPLWILMANHTLKAQSLLDARSPLTRYDTLWPVDIPTMLYGRELSPQFSTWRVPNGHIVLIRYQSGTHTKSPRPKWSTLPIVRWGSSVSRQINKWANRFLWNWHGWVQACKRLVKLFSWLTTLLWTWNLKHGTCMSSKSLSRGLSLKSNNPTDSDGYVKKFARLKWLGACLTIFCSGSQWIIRNIPIWNSEIFFLSLCITNT